MAAGIYERVFIVLFIQLILVILTVSSGCIKKPSSGNYTYPKGVEMVYRSQYVVSGTVRRKIADPAYPSIPTAYGVEFDVNCVFKGDATKVTPMIKIYGAGPIDPTCISADIKEPAEEPKEITVFLNHTGTKFVPTYGAPDIYVIRDVDELVAICDLIPEAPGGGSPTEYCPESDQSDCVRYEIPTVKPPTTIKVEKPVALTTTTKAPTPKPEPDNKENPTDKDTVVSGDKKPQETGDGSKASYNFISILSIFICLLSVPLLS